MALKRYPKSAPYCRALQSCHSSHGHHPPLTRNPVSPRMVHAVAGANTEPAGAYAPTRALPLRSNGTAWPDPNTFSRCFITSPCRSGEVAAVRTRVTVRCKKGLQRRGGQCEGQGTDFVVPVSAFGDA